MLLIPDVFGGVGNFSDEDRLNLWCEKGNEALREHNFHDACLYFGYALEIAPEEERAKEGRAQAVLKAAEQARSFATQAYKSLQEYGIERVARGESLEERNVLLILGPIDHAIMHYRNILKYLPDDPEALEKMSMLILCSEGLRTCLGLNQ